jgi:hypothetical protein
MFYNIHLYLLVVELNNPPLKKPMEGEIGNFNKKCYTFFTRFP